MLSRAEPNRGETKYHNSNNFSEFRVEKNLGIFKPPVRNLVSPYFFTKN